jgi:asparagine synthase (glutamine-hydrolysing)
LDSSIISAVSSRYFLQTGSGALNTYSIDYEGNSQFFKSSVFQPDPDAPWVKRASEEFSTRHHYITLNNEDVAKALNAAVEARDLPGMADIDSSLLLFCNEVKRNATVALSGECADEVFGGYPWFFMEDRLNSGTFPWSGGMSERKRIMSAELENIVQPDYYLGRRYRSTLEEVPVLTGESVLDARRREMFYLNITWFMLSLLERKDRMSMACGLEVRVPFCDHRLVQYLWNIPWEYKSMKGREKGLLRQAMKDILPEDVLWRKKSPYPKTHWLRKYRVSIK